MLFSFGVLLILCGFVIMEFGLLIFYAWLPLLYALIRLEIGFLLGKLLAGDVLGTMAIVLGSVGAITSAGAAYFLNPYRRILLGFPGSALLSVSLATLLDLDGLTSGVLGIVLLVAGGVVGAMLPSPFFSLFVIVVTAFGGATLVVTGAHVALPIMGWTASGFLFPTLIAIILTLIGMGWQLSNFGRWKHEPRVHDPLADRTGHGGPTKRRES